MTSMMNHLKQKCRYFDTSKTPAIREYLTKLNPGFIWNFFEKNHIPYNSQRADFLLLPPAKSTRDGVDSLPFRGSLLWNNLPCQVKESQTLEEFTNIIKNLISISCTCTIFR